MEWIITQNVYSQCYPCCGTHSLPLSLVVETRYLESIYFYFGIYIVPSWESAEVIANSTTLGWTNKLRRNYVYGQKVQATANSVRSEPPPPPLQSSRAIAPIKERSWLDLPKQPSPLCSPFIKLAQFPCDLSRRPLFVWNPMIDGVVKFQAGSAIL